jgi:hypothetical protein
MRSIVDLTIRIRAHDPPTMRLISRRPIDGDRVTMTGKLARTGHGVRIVVEHRGGTYRVVQVTVDAPDDGKSEITSALLGIPVKEVALATLAEGWSLFSITSDEMTVREGDERRQEYYADFVTKQRRRTLDDAHIRRVAEVYMAAEQAGAAAAMEAVDAVKDEFVVSRATAERWVREARKRGFLPPGRRSRVKD